MSILDHVPEGFTLRDVQTKVLLEVEKQWDFHRVIVCQVPVGGGKSLIAATIAAWQKSFKKTTAIVTPKVVLQDQYEETFNNLPSLKGKGRYTCKQKGNTCGDWNEATDHYCDGCPFVAARARVKVAPTSIFNFHTYLYTREARKNVLIIDEAHNTSPVLSGMYALKIWKHIDDYDDINTYGDLAVWLENKIDNMELFMENNPPQKGNKHLFGERKRISSKIRRFRLVLEGLVKAPTNFLIENKSDYYRGVRHDVLEVRPINLKYIPHGLWGQDTDKIILMSATIHKEDIADLGLERMAVHYIESGSPIPADNRPFVIKPVALMTYKHRQESLPKIQEVILELAERHKGEKGLVHTTYAVAEQLRRTLKDPRFMWHTQETKEQVYGEFLNANGDPILVASGMSEGVDLAGDLARWQVLTQVVYPSLADKLNVKKRTDRPSWFTYQAWTDIMQRTGRVCRGPEDYGVTYILDNSFMGLFRQVRRKGLVPKYFSEAVKLENNNRG